VSALTLTRAARAHLAGRPTHRCPIDDVLLCHDDYGHVVQAESLTAAGERERWLLTRHAPGYARSYWLATPLAPEGSPHLARGLLDATQYKASTLARLLAALERAPAPLRDVGSTTLTRPTVRP